MSKVTKFGIEEVVKETNLVYISRRPSDPTESYEIEGKFKKRDPKKHAKRKELDRLLRFPELALGFYYYDIYVVKLKIGKKIIELKSGKVNKSKEYKV